MIRIIPILILLLTICISSCISISSETGISNENESSYLNDEKSKVDTSDDIDFSQQVEEFNKDIFITEEVNRLPVYKISPVDRIKKIERIGNFLNISDLALENIEDFQVTFARSNGVELQIRRDGSFRINLNPQFQNSEAIESEDELLDLAQKYFIQYSELFKIGKPEFTFKEIYGIKKVIIRDKEIEDDDPVLFYYQTIILEIDLDTGQLKSIDSNFYDLGIIDDMQLITEREARNKIDSGIYFSPFGINHQDLGEYKILSSGLKYLFLYQEDFVQPFYSFIVQGGTNSTNEDTYIFYVQAINPDVGEYLIPLPEGIYN